MAFPLTPGIAGLRVSSHWSHFEVILTDIDLKGDWLLFVAGTTSRETSDMLIGDVVKWLKENPTSLPLTDLYDTHSGG
jgi:Domain of unknown function (DUF1793)